MVHLHAAWTSKAAICGPPGFRAVFPEGSSFAPKSSWRDQDHLDFADIKASKGE